MALSLLLGVVTGALGAALPLLRTAYALGDGSGTEAVVLYNLGALAAILGCGLGARGGRTGRGRVTALLLAFAAGSAGLALAPAWWVLCGFALLAGAGYGGLILQLNTFLAQPATPRPVLMLNLLHACFGAGATLGPLLVGRLDGVSGLLLTTGCLALLLLTARRTGDVAEEPGTASPAPASLPLLTVFAAAALLYAGVEAGIGALESTHLAAAGYPAARAAEYTALFWAGLTAGRLVLPWAAGRLGPPRLIGLCLLAAAGALAATTVGAWAPTAYGLAGLALAAVFPTALAWANALLPAPQRVNSVLLVANLVGSAALPHLIGLAAGPGRTAVIPLALTGLTLLTGAAVVLAARLARRPAPVLPGRTSRTTPHAELERSP
nr:MFS transporter [Streptomyces sp. HNM0574]